MQDANDMDLLREFARNNSEEAFAELVRRHINLVYSVALRFTSNTADAQDTTQAVFIILARKAAGIRERIVLTGWLYETTRLTAAGLFRTQSRRQAREQESYMQNALSEASAESVWRQLAPLLEEAMAKLDEKERTLLALHFYENKSIAETAMVMGIREWAARKRAARAVEKLRTFFSKRGVALSAAVLTTAIASNSIQAAPAALAQMVTATAIAKGAMASTSTLTLIKGSLKIMAWTKMKTAAVTTAVVILATIGTVSVMNRAWQSHRMKLPTGRVTQMVGYGYSHYGVFLASDGSLWSWGEERNGWPTLGLENTNIQNTVSLRRIGKETDWVKISVGMDSCLAIQSDGSLWAWGANYIYQLGDGTKITRPTPEPSVPGNDWKEIAAGQGTSFAVKNDGTLWGWGDNYSGQLGIGDAKASTNAVQIGASTNWAKIWAGSFQTIGLHTDGSLWFWGSFDGNSRSGKKLTLPTRISPDTNWVDACFGYFTMFAIKSDGTLWTWGREANFYAGLTDTNLNSTPLQVGQENDWQSCASAPGGFYHLLRKKDGSLWALDASDHRTIKPASEYKRVELKEIDLHKDVAVYAAGGDNLGVVVTRDGEVWTWGNVIGEHSPMDYFDQQTGEQKFPKLNVRNEPWQLSIVNSPD